MKDSLEYILFGLYLFLMIILFSIVNTIIIKELHDRFCPWKKTEVHKTKIKFDK